MDENPKSSMAYLAPGASSGASTWRLSAEGSRPGVEDHVVAPEITRDELVRGKRVIASPAMPPHGDQHTRLDYVVTAHLRPGYVGSTDLLTRWNEGSDFASDTSIRKTGIDPATGQRFLEEIAFEIVSTQSQADARVRAEDMAARGVRRVFAIFVKKGTVAEWSARMGAFHLLNPESEIRDEALSQPLPVKALLDAAVAHRAVVRAREASGDPEIEAIKSRSRAEGEARGETQGEARGEARGKAKSIVAILELRGLEVSPSERVGILSCSDAPTLDRWLSRALSIAATAELFD